MCRMLSIIPYFVFPFSSVLSVQFSLLFWISFTMSWYVKNSSVCIRLWISAFSPLSCAICDSSVFVCFWIFLWVFAVFVGFPNVEKYLFFGSRSAFSSNSTAIVAVNAKMARFFMASVPIDSVVAACATGAFFPVDIPLASVGFVFAAPSSSFGAVGNVGVSVIFLIIIKAYLFIVSYFIEKYKGVNYGRGYNTFWAY